MHRVRASVDAQALPPLRLNGLDFWFVEIGTPRRAEIVSLRPSYGQCFSEPGPSVWGGAGACVCSEWTFTFWLPKLTHVADEVTKLILGDTAISAIEKPAVDRRRFFCRGQTNSP